MGKPLNSAVVIARLLGTEGCTDHVAKEVERYWRRTEKLTDGQKERIRKLEVGLAELASKLTEAEKALLGKFIGWQKKMSFQTGLKIGLTCLAVKCAQDYEEPAP